MRRTSPGWNGLAALGLAGLACVLSGTALLVALGTSVPPMVASASAITLQRREIPTPRPEAPLPLIAIELLLPHLPRSAPFPRAFAVASALATGDAETARLLATLASVAAEGAPTIRQLNESFAPVADAAVLAEMGFAADAGWLARRAAATMRLGVSLGSAGTPGLAALQDAATHLVAGDAVAAEAALAKLSDATMSALGPWRAGLARRIAADAALTRLAALNVTRTRDLTP